MNKALEQYLALEKILGEWDNEGRGSLASALRDILDELWYYHLTDEDHQFLDQRT